MRYAIVREIAAIGKKHDILTDGFDSQSTVSAGFRMST
jgi:hypothetical protein